MLAIIPWIWNYNFIFSNTLRVRYVGPNLSLSILNNPKAIPFHGDTDNAMSMGREG